MNRICYFLLNKETNTIHFKTMFSYKVCEKMFNEYNTKDPIGTYHYNVYKRYYLHYRYNYENKLSSITVQNYT